MSRRSQIVSATGLISVVTFASRLLGVLRDSIIAAHLGATRYNDIFQIAFAIPNLARRVLGEGALSAFIVPIITGIRRKKGEAAAWLSTCNAFNLFALITLALTVLGCMFSTPLFFLYGGAHFQFADQPELLALGGSLTRIMFPYLMLLALVALLMGVLHSLKHFLAPALGSIVVNIVVITAALLFFKVEDKRFFLYVLACAVMIGAVIRLLILFPPLIRRGFRWRPVFQWREQGFRELGSKLPAAVYGTAIAQINIAITLNLANWCGEGSVTYLQYSQRLIQLPLALFATALATALLPQLSAVIAENNRRDLRDLMTFAFRAIALLFFPAAIGLMVLGRPIVQFLFERREWSSMATDGTALALLCYAFGLVALGAQRIFIPLYYAQKDMITPVKYGAVAMLANIVLAVTLMLTLRAYEPSLSFAGLALASALSSTLNVWLLWRGLTRRFGHDLAGPIGSTLLRALFCAALMGVICGVGFRASERMLEPSGTLALLALTVTWVFAGLAVYAIASRVAGLWDREAITRLFRR